MPNFIQESSLDPTKFVTPTSRYLESKVIYYTNLNRITFAIYKRKPFVPDSQDKFMVVTSGLEYRPDLVSNRAYGFPDFWWKIMEANNIFDVFDFKAGTNIRIPSARL